MSDKRNLGKPVFYFVKMWELVLSFYGINFFHSGGTKKFGPEKYDYLFGSYLNLNGVKFQ